MFHSICFIQYVIWRRNRIIIAVRVCNRVSERQTDREMIENVERGRNTNDNDNDNGNGNDDDDDKRNRTLISWVALSAASASSAIVQLYQK